MANLVLLLAISMSFSSANALPLKTMIVGGRDANVHEFPFIVSIQTKKGGHFCGGSLIRPNWVLTASHCMKGVKTAKVLIGLHEQSQPKAAESIAIKQVIMHPLYNPKTMDYDFALIEIFRNSSYPPIELNEEEIDIQTANPPTEIFGTVSGWGNLSGRKNSRMSDILQKVDVPLVAKNTCNYLHKGQITDRMLCAGYPDGGKDSCLGDSGGPLVIKDPAGRMKQIGVVSWGEGCALPNYPGIYAKVNSVIDWINISTQ